MFTALHRLLGQKPGPITDELLDAAIEAALAETEDVDWKGELPPTRNLSEHDFPKDVAAMANSGGGVIVYGVEENEKRATGRKDVGELDENHERTLRAAAFGAITPPVFGLGVHRVGESGKRAVVVVVPASIDGPHLIFKNKLFGAPIRNDADTEWMKERQIEASYRARLDDRRHATRALENMYEEAATNWSTGERAWLIAVARPRLPFTATTRPTREEARDVITDAERLALTFAGGQGGVHPLANVDRHNPRPGLRRWTLANAATQAHTAWRAAWAAVHHDGSVGLAGAIGGHPTRESELDGNQIESAAIECGVADFMALIAAVSKHRGLGEYEVSVGIEWAGKPLVIRTVDNSGYPHEGSSIPLTKYVPVNATVIADAELPDYHWQVHDLAEHCINQGGITNVRLINPPARDE